MRFGEGVGALGPGGGGGRDIRLSFPTNLGGGGGGSFMSYSVSWPSSEQRD